MSTAVSSGGSNEIRDDESHEIIFLCILRFCYKRGNKYILGDGNLNFVGTCTIILCLKEVCRKVFSSLTTTLRPTRLVQWLKFGLEFLES